jgi:hypothetical protein
VFGGTLRIDGNSNDTVIARGFRETDREVEIGRNEYEVYRHAATGAELLINEDIGRVVV